MARCQVIGHSWTFCGLVGAFLDLGIAYLLLCCSAIAFFVSRVLAFFGLSLPCPCNGLFGYPNSDYCVQRLLVDYPTKTVSNLQLSVKSKFPFDAVLARNDHGQLNLKLVKERNFDDGALEFDGEASYSSFSDPRRSQHSLSGSDSVGKLDFKGKGVANQRQRCGSLRRRRRGSIDYGRFSSASSYDHTRSDFRAIRRSPSDPTKLGNELNIELLKPVYYHDYGSNEATDQGKLMYDNANSFQNLENNVRHADGVDGEDENAIRILEQELEEEQAARLALCSELEQERTAAATAADEAMAMISRLQEEKAAFEMEARQYQRILEEKSSYDAEEMDILKEIIVRRECEKHYLEREVEAYQKMFQDNEGLENQDDDAQGQYEASFLDSSVNPMLILQQLSESIDKRDGTSNKRNRPDYVSASVEKQSFTIPSGNELLIRQSVDETNVVEVLQHPECSRIPPDHLPNQDESFDEVQEKGMLSMDEIPYPHICKTSSTILESASLLSEDVQSGDVHPHKTLLPGVVKTDGGKEMIVQVGKPHVHDVHVINSKCDTIDKIAGKELDPLLMRKDVPSFPRKVESPFEASKELEIIRSHSDTIDKLLSVSSSTSQESASGLRRSSMPAMGHERLKIDSEVEWLRARLKAVQEEKEKLKSSLERQERGQAELQILEDIASQIREIRHLTEPEKAARQGSLPPLSSKVPSKKKRSRSTSVGAGQSQSS